MQRYVESIAAAKAFRKKHDERYAKGDNEKEIDRSIWNQQIDTF